MKRIILSGGGTGGHIYPAVAVAEALKRKWGDEVELLFVGAEGKMEMDKIPALGYRIVGLPILGLQRRFTWKNFTVPFRVLRSISKARRTIRDFGADAVVGFGGYASAPVLWAAQRAGVPTVIQEQNSFAGLTNKILARRARRICVAYDGMEAFFPQEKITMTGNPLRGRFSASGTDRGEALAHYGLSLGKPVVLVVGGSLGTRTLNEMMKSWILSLDGKQPPVQVIWQTGKYYEKEICCGRCRHIAQRRLHRLGAVSGSQADDIRPLAQRGGGPPDQKRHGAGRQGCRDDRARQRGRRTRHGRGDRAYGQRRASATSLAKHSLARDSRLGRPHRGTDREDMVIRNTPLRSGMNRQ